MKRSGVVPRLGRARWIARATTLAAALSSRAIAWGDDPAPRPDPGVEAIRVSLRGPRDCPDGDELAARVRGRTARVRFAAPGERARSFRVDVRGAPPDVVADISLEDPTGRTARRELHAPRCDEVVDAAALVIALAVDPHAGGGSRPGVVERPAPTPPAPPSPAASAAPPPPAPSHPPPRAPAPPRPAPPRAPPRAARVHVALGAHAGLRGALAPSPLRLTAAFAELARETDRLLAPSVRLWLAHAPARTFDTALGAASFEWTGAALDLCPVAARLAPGVHARPCARLEGGALRASGVTVAVPRRDTRAFFSAGATARLSGVLFRTLALEIQGGIDFPFTKDRFFFQPDVTIHEVPPVGWVTTAGLGVVLP